ERPARALASCGLTPLGPRLDECKGGAPAARMGDFSFRRLSKLLEFLFGNQLEQSRFEGHAELHREAQIGMSGRKCAYVSSYRRTETGAPEKFDRAAPRIQLPSRRNKRFDEESNETFRGRRRRVEVPGPKVRVFQNHPPTRRNEAQIAPELLGGSSQ